MSGHEHSMLGSSGFFGGVYVSRFVMFLSEYGLLWCQLCNTYCRVYHYCQELTLLQQETAC